MYNNQYKPTFPTYTISKETLKKHIWEQLQELDTSIVDEYGQTLMLQDELVINEMRNTSSMATCY